MSAESITAGVVVLVMALLVFLIIRTGGRGGG
jgi:hypothetical protein